MNKALFFDIDGTLVNFNGKMLDSTRDALKRVQHNGHKIVLCSGRSLCQMYPWLLNMDFDGIIAGSGAFVMYGDQVIYEHHIQGETLKKVIEVMREAKAYYFAQTRTKLVSLSEHNVPVRIRRIREREQVAPPPIEIDPKIQCRQDVEKVSYFDAEMPLEDIVAQLSDCCEITAMSFENSTHYSGEITDKGVNKALGIQKFIEYLGIPKDNTISFGDGANDYEMIEYTNIGVAMGNATDALKQKATYVTKHIDDHGIYHALREFELL